MLVLYMIGSLIIRIKASKPGSIKAWVDNSIVAQWTDAVVPYGASMPPSLYVEPMRSCAKLCYDLLQMSVAAVWDVWLTSIRHFDIFIDLGFVDMLICAQLGPLRGSCPREHMQAIPGPLPGPSQPVHEAMTVKSTYPRGDKRRGHAQSSKLYFNASSPVGTRQWALRNSNDKVDKAINRGEANLLDT